MLAQIRREIYGEFYDATVVPMLKLAALQRHQKKDDMFIETCQEGIELAKGILALPETAKNKEREQNMSKMCSEFLEMLLQQYMHQNNKVGQQELADQLCEHQKKYFGSESV